MAKRNRTVGSIKSELVVNSRDAALTAIRTFNDPHVSFKSETYVVLMIIAWTYLLHAYYRSKGSNTGTTHKVLKDGNLTAQSMLPTSTGSWSGV